MVNKESGVFSKPKLFKSDSQTSAKMRSSMSSTKAASSNPSAQPRPFPTPSQSQRGKSGGTIYKPPKIPMFNPNKQKDDKPIQPAQSESILPHSESTDPNPQQTTEQTSPKPQVPQQPSPTHSKTQTSNVYENSPLQTDKQSPHLDEEDEFYNNESAILNATKNE